MSKKRQWLPLILLFLIILITFLLRFYKLGDIPEVLTRDEAAVGYNAYSILKTGKDEYGIRYPLWFLSFGDYKNPLYIYLSVPVIKIFGLNGFSTRFLSALAGSLTIITVYFLLEELLKTTTINKSKIISLLSAFFLAVSPWHIFYSRMVYESILALFFVVTGILFLLKAREKQYFFLPSLICFILSFFTYNPPIFILPILIPIILILFRKNYFTKSKFALIFLLFFYFSLFFYFILSKNLIIGRSESTIFSKNYYENQLALRRINNLKEPLGFKFFLREKPYIFYKFLSNYFSVFKTEFLFLKGDGHLWHGIRQGNQYLITLPFFILGLFFIFKERKKEYLFILSWFFLSPIACSFTQDAPNTTRLHDFLFLYLLISSFGFYYLFLKFKKFGYIFLLAVFFIIFFNLANYLKVYFGEYSKRLCNKEFSSMWLCGIKEVVKYTQKNTKKYNQIFIVTSEYNEEPYIQFAFYLEVDPLYFQKNAEREKTYFIKVKKLGRYYFEELPIGVKISDKSEINKIIKRFNKPKSLFIVRDTDNLTENISLKEMKRINDSNGQPLWLFLEK